MDSQKHRDFVGEPMANKSVKELPGVGATLGNRFERAGYSKETPCHSQIKVEEMEFKLEDLHHSIEISDDPPILEVPLDREYEPERGQKRMDKYSHLIKCEKLEDAIDGLRVPSNHNEMEAMDAELKELHTSFDIKEDDDSDFEHQEDSDEETPGHSQIEVEEMEFKLEDLNHSIDISDEPPILEVPLDREYEPERGQKRIDKYSHLIKCEKLEDAIDGLRVPSNHNEMEAMDAELKELHTSFDIKEDDDSDFEHQEDSDEETPGLSQIEVVEMEFKLEDLHHSIEISDAPILEVPLDREYEPERGQKRMDKPGLRVPSNHHEMEVMDAELKELHTSFDIKEDDDSDFEHQEDSDKETPGHSQIEVEEMEKLEDLHHSIEISDDHPILEVPLDREYESKRGQKRMDKPGLRVPSNHHEMEVMDAELKEFEHQEDSDKVLDDEKSSGKSVVKKISKQEIFKPFVCNKCKKSFAKYPHLVQHERFHEDIKAFGCDYEGCGKRFAILIDLNDHKRKVHTRERPFTCHVCGKSFLTKSVFYQHQLIHSNDRRYGCEMCDKKFLRSSVLTIHMRTHTREKPYVCEICGKAFRDKTNINRHIKNVHSK